MNCEFIPIAHNHSVLRAARRARCPDAPCPPLHANACLAQYTYACGNQCSSCSQPKNPAKIPVPTKPGCTPSEGHWLNPDLVGKWSHFPADSLPPRFRSNSMHSAFHIPFHSADTLSLEFRNLNYLSLDHTPAPLSRPFPFLSPGRPCCTLPKPRLEPRRPAGTPAHSLPHLPATEMPYRSFFLPLPRCRPLQGPFMTPFQK